jgi:uncharacterized protein involved in exopolysaccharide biosynthesis
MDKNEQGGISGLGAESMRPLYVTIAPPVGGGIALVDLWEALWRGRWMVIGLCVLSAVVSVFYALSATSIYRSEVVLAPASKGAMSGTVSPLGGLASLAGISLGGATDEAEALAMLASNGFTAAFVRDKKLLPVLFADRWDAQGQKWKVPPEEQPDVRDGVRFFREGVLSISENEPKTGLVTLAIEWTDPQTAAGWAGELVQRLNETARRRDVAESQRKLDYLNQEMSKATIVELRQAISRVIQDQINAMMLAQAQSEYAFKVIDPPTIPKRRIWPQRTLIVLLAVLLAAFVGTFIVLVRFAIKRTQINRPA